MRELEEGTALELRSHASAEEEDVAEARKLGVRTLRYLYKTYGRKRARGLVLNKASYVLGYIDGRLAAKAEEADND